MRASPLLWAVAALAFPTGALAQLRAATPAQVTRAYANQDVVPITRTLLDQVRKAVRMEITLRQQFKQELARYRSTERYSQCADEAAMSPEGMKIAMAFADLPDKSTPADMQRAAEKMNAAMSALIKKLCGGDIREDWPDHKRKERLEAIEAQAAATIAAGSDPPLAARSSGPAAHDVGGRGIPLMRYRLIRERYVAWCTIVGPIAVGRLRELTEEEWDLAAPGAGEGNFWIFLKNEITEIGDSCDEWLELMGEYDDFDWPL